MGAFQEMKVSWAWQMILTFQNNNLAFHFPKKKIKRFKKKKKKKIKRAFDKYSISALSLPLVFRLALEQYKGIYSFFLYVYFFFFHTSIERFDEFFLSILSFKDSVDQLRMK